MKAADTQRFMEDTTVPANREELAFKFRSINERLARSKPELTNKNYGDRLVSELISAVPSAAFDAIQPFDEGILFFHSGVEEDQVTDLQHDLLRAHLNLDPETPILLNLSSTGGSVYAGLALVSTIYDIQRRGRKVNVHIQGVAMSMASVIAQVADYRTIEPSAFFMLHKISYGLRGSTDEHEEELAFTNKLHEAMFSIYAARTGKQPSEYMQLLKKQNLYLNAKEALEAKLVDAIIEAPIYKTIIPGQKPAVAPKKPRATK
jgi:ATP-dependent protease ClpP protease subunit